MSIRQQVSNFAHRYLRLPYTLNTVEFQSPKKPKATLVFIHGIGNSAHAWDDVVKKLPKDVRIIGVDLLGFGKSPKPAWAQYNAKTQARSVGLTILGMRLAQQPILVGHSLGALISVEIAKRYPLAIQRLVLCSPPFYKPSETKGVSQDDILKNLYRTALKHPERLPKLSPLAVKAGLANKVLNITEDNVNSYVAALESSIINQTSLSDVYKLSQPIDIFYGTFDAVVVKKHITDLAKTRKKVTAKKLLAGHEVTGTYATALAKHLNELID